MLFHFCDSLIDISQIYTFIKCNKPDNKIEVLNRIFYSNEIVIIPLCELMTIASLQTTTYQVDCFEQFVISCLNTIQHTNCLFDNGFSQLMCN